MAADRRSYSDPCGIARALDVIGERWAVLVLRELMFGPRRFGQLLDGLPGISPNVLSQRLRELEDGGVVRRYTLEPPAAVAVYELTERGTALEPVLLELGRWGSRTARVGGRELSPAAMLMALRTMFDPTTGGSVVYGVQLAGEWYTFTIAGGELRIVRGRPDDPVATLSTDVTTLRLVTFLGTGVKAAEQAGRLAVEGDRRAANRFPRYFRRPEPAPSQ
jgi:DNA-binding HxlR family transcriptional regulator